MQDPMMQFGNSNQGVVGSMGEVQNRVLRDTYILLAISMIPTILGAVIGIQAGIYRILASFGSIALFVMFMVTAMGLMWGIRRTANSSMGVVMLMLFTFFMGLFLSLNLAVALSYSNGGELITLAAGGTGAVFFVMAGIATVSGRDFSNMGKFLTVGLVVVLLAIVANLFLNIPAFSLAISCVIIILFSGYLLYDINAIVRGGETNYIMATLNVYIDVYNIFASLLHVLTSLFGSRD